MFEQPLSYDGKLVQHCPELNDHHDFDSSYGSV